MPNYFSNSDGTVRPAFQIGLGEGSPKLMKQDDHLVLNLPLRFTKDPNHAVIEPDHDEDAITLGYLTKRLNQNYNDTVQYMNKVLADLFGDGTTPPEGGGGDPETPPENPGGISLGNIMLMPTDITTLTDGATQSLGILPRMKFISRIVLELHEAFSTAAGDEYELAIGTAADLTKFIPWTNLMHITETIAYEVLKTLVDDTELIASIRKVVVPEPEPIPEYEPTFFTYGRDRVMATTRKDASGRVISVNVFCENASNEEVLDTDTFGTDVLGQGYMDFGINMPLELGKTYRIVQNNPALAVYADIDPTIALTDEGWLKSKEYTIESADTEFIYQFLLGHAAGDDDYVHIWLYDTASETGEAMFSFHIKNEIELPVQPAEELMPLAVTAETDPVFSCEVLGLDEISCTFNSVKSIDGDTSYYVLAGECHDRKGEHDWSVDIDPSIPLSYIMLHLDKLTIGEVYNITVMNPLYDHIADRDWVLRDDLGRRYISTTIIADNSSASFVVPFSNDNDYNIAIHVTRESDGFHKGFVFENRVTFINRPLVYDEGIAPMALDALAVDAGRLSIRILSF